MYSKKELGRIRSHVIWTLFFYTLAIVLVHALKSSPDLLDMVQGCKMVSLLLAVLVSYSIWKDEADHWIRSWNIGITAFMIVILGICLLKFFVPNMLGEGADGKLDLSPWSIRAFRFLFDNAFWITALPFIAFAVLDGSVVLGKYPENRKLRTLVYVVFVDLVCACPLAFIIALSLLRFSLGTSKEEVELFVGGAMALLILAHAIAAKAADVYTDKLEKMDVGAPAEA